ncbi:hypothetical protein ACFYO2_01390 [Streptomyces sp. NPDC006602]|uniref:hypothetical protein n=1 Tax=Streptomyces sp. NPDC006602 TaxID=3364751 RepID=UPI003689B546
MGIRMLHRRTAHARAQAKAHAETAPPVPPPPPLPAFAAAASTARIPTDLAMVLRRARFTVPADLAASLRRVTTTGTDRIPADLAKTLRRAATARTARLPADLGTALRHAAAGTRRRRDRREWRERKGVRQEREAAVRRLWAVLRRGYPVLVLALLRRSRPTPAFTVFTAVSERPTGAPPRPRPDRRAPGPDATP